MPTTNPALFIIDRMSAIAGLVLNGSKVFGVIVKYLSGNDKSRQTFEMATDTLIEIGKSINSKLDDNEAYKIVLSYSK